MIWGGCVTVYCMLVGAGGDLVSPVYVHHSLVMSLHKTANPKMGSPH
jgi:hypothetical protein